MKQSPKNTMIGDSPIKKGSVRPPKKNEVKKKDEEKKTEPEDESSEVQIIAKNIIEQETPELAFSKLTRSQVNLIKNTVAKGATDNELRLFISVCHATKLNPFLRQVHFVKRWDSKLLQEVGVIQVGIDGFRAIAEESGQYAGSDDAIHKDQTEKELVMGKVKVKKDVPGSATVTVYKLIGEQRYPFTATARWDEYYPGDKQGYMWAKMPYGQLAKCAEALALRKAFPKLLSGLYVPEEMDQAQTAENSEESDFKKTEGIINSMQNPNTLIDAREKIKNSKKTYDGKKKELLELIENRLKELEARNA